MWKQFLCTEGTDRDKDWLVSLWWTFLSCDSKCILKGRRSVVQMHDITILLTIFSKGLTKSTNDISIFYCIFQFISIIRSSFNGDRI